MVMLSLAIGNGIDLRLLEERHAEAVFALADRNREHLRPWLPWVDYTKSADDVRRFIRETLDQFANNLGFHAGIWVHGELSGGIGFHPINWLNRNTSIGYWLGASFQGKGIVTQACRACIDYAFRELKLNRVEIRCAPGNTRSCAIPERLGFTREGVIRQAQWVNDRFLDNVVYGILASEWRSTHLATLSKNSGG
jgi:ribosomal-protein-serine acetyltransferase